MGISCEMGGANDLEGTRFKLNEVRQCKGCILGFYLPFGLIVKYRDHYTNDWGMAQSRRLSAICM